MTPFLDWLNSIQAVFKQEAAADGKENLVCIYIAQALWMRQGCSINTVKPGNAFAVIGR